MKRKYTLIGIVVVLIVIVLTLLFSNRDTSPIKVGFLGALSGDIASLGDEAKNSTILAVKEINAVGGIDGRQLEIIYEDGKCSGIGGASAVKKLVEVDKVGIIFGGTCSSETLAAIPITESSKTLLFTSWALNPKVTDSNDFVFRNAPSDVGGASAVADLAYKNGVRKVAIITENTDYTLGFESVFSTRFKSLGGEILTNDIFNPDDRDPRSIISKNMTFPADAILVNANGSNAGLVSKILANLGNKKPLYGSIFFADANVLKNYGQYMEGGYTSEPANLDVNNSKVAAYLAAYEKEFKSKPQYLFWAAASYDAVKIFAEAVKKVGYDTTKIKDYLYSMKEYDGVLGKYSFDKNGDVVGVKFEDKQIMNGQLQVVK